MIENFIAISMTAILFFFAYLVIPEMLNTANDSDEVGVSGANSALNSLRKIGMVLSIVVTIGSASYWIFPYIYDSTLAPFIKLALSASIAITIILLAISIDLNIKKQGNLAGSLFATKQFGIVFTTSVATLLVLYFLNYSTMIASASNIASVFTAKIADDSSISTYKDLNNINKKQLANKLKEQKMLQAKINNLSADTYTDAYIEAKEAKISYWKSKAKLSKSNSKQLEYSKYISDLKLDIAKHKGGAIKRLSSRYNNMLNRLEASISKLKENLKNNSDEVYTISTNTKREAKKLGDEYESTIMLGVFWFNVLMFVIDVIMGILGSFGEPIQKVDEYETVEQEFTKQIDSEKDYVFNKIPIEKQVVLYRALFDLTSWGRGITQKAVRDRANTITSLNRDMLGLDKFSIGAKEFVDYIRNPKVLASVSSLKNGTTDSVFDELLDRMPNARGLFFDEDEEREVA